MERPTQATIRFDSDREDNQAEAVISIISEVDDHRNNQPKRTPLEYFLCRPCDSILSDWDFHSRYASSAPSVGKAYSHHSNFHELQVSALTGCHLCSHIVRYISPDFRLFMGPYRVETRPPWHDGRQEGLNANQIHISSTIGGCYIEVLRYRAQSQPHFHAVMAGISRPESLEFLSTDNEATFRLAKQWLQISLQEHETCAEHITKQRFIPARLLHLKLENGHMMVNLCSRGKLSSGIKYFTLSHRWGAIMPKRLTRRNIEQLVTASWRTHYRRPSWKPQLSS